MVSGHVNLGQITDKGLVLIIEARDNSPGLSVSQGQITAADGSATATLGWRDADGLKAVAQLLRKLAELP